MSPDVLLLNLDKWTWNIGADDDYDCNNDNDCAGDCEGPKGPLEVPKT